MLGPLLDYNGCVSFPRGGILCLVLTSLLCFIQFDKLPIVTQGNCSLQ